MSFGLLGRFGNVMQSEQFGAWARRNSVRATLIVAEFHERSFFVELLNDSTDLPASKSLRRKIRQQCHYVQDGRPLVHCTVCRIHRLYSAAGECTMLGGGLWPAP